MATNAFTAQGTTIEINTIEIGEATEFSGPETTNPTVPATHLKSIAVETLPGLAENGEFSVTCNGLPLDPGQIEVERLQKNRASGTLRVTYPNAVLIQEFDVNVTGFSRSGSVGEVHQVEITFEVTGPITRTPALPT